MSTEEKRAAALAYYYAHREVYLARRRQWYRDNLDRAKAYASEYIRRPEVKAHRAELKRSWYYRTVRQAGRARKANKPVPLPQNLNADFSVEFS
jgi:hypothetical protein